MQSISKTLIAFGAISLTASGAFAARPTAGSVTPERLKVPAGPGSVRGLADEPSIDPFSAQIEYQVPIELPGGYGGLAPSLALAYSGSLGNGPIGIGWTLAEPRIQRSSRLGVPHFDDTDTLEISGIASGRLVPIGGGEYRVEGLGQTVRIVTSGAGFEVDDGKGVHYKLGVSAAARQDRDPTHTFGWRLEEVRNLMGERMRYEYSQDHGQVYLTRIVWGPSDAYSVTLSYGPRGDTVTSFREGLRVDTAQRLTSIHVISRGLERRAYQLAYDASFQVARLSGVTSTGVAGAGAWPALAFTYAAPVAPHLQSVAGIGNWRLNASGTTLVDLDGDGAAELLQLGSGGHSYLSNQNGTFSGLQPMTGNAQPISLVQMQDVDGDGRAELLQDTGNGWAVYKFTRTQWVQQATTWPGSPGLALKQPTNTRFADLNGDGLVDAIQWDNDNLKIHLATRTGIAAAYNVPRIGGVVLPSALGRFHDINGDGLDDYIVTATDHLDTYIGHGDGTFEPRVAVAYPFAGTISSSDDIELGDLDRDGLIDLLHIQLGAVQWFRGKPGGTFAATPVTLANPETLTSSVVVAVTDINGNGSQDVVWSSTSGMWWMDLAGTTTAGMLTRVDNGLGLDVTFQYDSSHALSVAAQRAGKPWTTNVPIAMPVPTQKTTALGVGETTRQINYGVRDGFWDAVEQRFAGFLTTTVTTAGPTAAETSTVMTRYNAGTGSNRALRGKPQNEQVLNGSGTRLSYTAYTWDTMPIAGLPDTPLLRRAVLREKLTQHEDTTPIRELDVTYTYDALGRAIRETDNGRLDLTGDEAVKTTRFADDDTTWIRDQVCEQTLTDLAGAVASDTQHLFGDDQTVQPLCTVGKGWARETRAWLASASRFVTQDQTSYDPHGNVIAQSRGGVTQRIVYDSDGVFPIEERYDGPDGELIWRAAWDSVLGVIVSTTDPDGHTAHASYDSLGRFIAAAIDDHAPHQIVEYDWTPPHPKTTTWTFDGALAEVTAKPATWTAGAKWRQSVDVSNGKGEVRYRGLRLGDTQWIISDYHERDPSSRVVFSGRPVYASSIDLAGRPAGMVGDSLSYDPLGRLIRQQAANDAVRTYAYTAFETTVQDTDHAPVHSVIDGQGRAILTERSLAGGTHEIVQAIYDPAGRLTRMTLAGGLVQREFAYDTLGRLVQSHDPDLGTRTLTYDDANRLTSETNAAGQAIHYTYDVLGRLATRDAFHYHYDTARPGANGVTNTTGRLAWIEEPTGVRDTGYDEVGRAVFTRHQIDGHTSETTTSFAASGLPLVRSYDDGFAVRYAYDAAGRVIGLGDLWDLLELDANGQPMHERARNGVDTRYERDVLGLPVRVAIHDATGAAVYDVTATRDLANQITQITDSDGVGLDHSAHFTYDGFTRLTAATVGAGAAQFSFSYAYDVLHNMTSRTQAGPHAINAFTGAYHYAEAGAASRQLTSISDATGAVTHTFHYDAAGRQVTEDALVLSYDATDRLVAITGLPGGSEQHAYGASGERVKTTAPDGTVSYLFGDGTRERDGVREHDVALGDRIIARVAVALEPSSGGAALGAVAIGARGVFGTVAVLALLVAAFAARVRIRMRRWASAALAALAALAGCSSPNTSTHRQLLAAPAATFQHHGFAPGPALFSDTTGELVEERRYEAFGVAIDARIRTDGTYVTGAPDVIARDLNVLNKRTDPVTGWSDHGARWMAPETARWTSTDPPVVAPDARFMATPWSLHPYQYVGQNPIAFWDPDGRDDANVCSLGEPLPKEVQDSPAEAHGEGEIEREGAPLPAVVEVTGPLLESAAAGTRAAEAASHAASGLEVVGKGMSAGIGIYHAVKIFTAHDLHEKREHVGGAVLAGLAIGVPPTAPFIALGELAIGDALNHAAGYAVSLGPITDWQRERDARQARDDNEIRWHEWGKERSHEMIQQIHELWYSAVAEVAVLPQVQAARQRRMEEATWRRQNGYSDQ